MAMDKKLIEKMIKKINLSVTGCMGRMGQQLINLLGQWNRPIIPTCI